MSVDTFLEQDFEDEDSKVDENEDSEVEESQSGDEIEEHKAALTKLKDTDPEFYKFLQENDKKLLEFNLSDEEPDEDEENAPHQPPDELEVASDESDFEDETQVTDRGTVTLKMLKKWETAIQGDKSNKTIITVMKAFHAALITVSSDEDQEPAQFKVEGSAVFNGVIQLCVLHLGPALRRFLGLKTGSKQPPHKCKRFTKIKRVLKDYFMDLSKVKHSIGC